VGRCRRWGCGETQLREIAMAFYVYEHIRNDILLPFYVGKGKDNRAYIKNNRNNYWNNIVNKCDGFNVRFIAQNIDEELALLVEKERIEQLRLLKINICNLTNGGEGISGYKFTNEQKKKMSESHKGKKLSQNQIEKITQRFKSIERTEKWKKNISNSLKGKKKNSESIRKTSENRTKYVFCISENKLFRSAEDAGKYYKICKSSVSRACSGNRAKAKKMSWRYATAEDLKCFHLTPI
jgi:hypothetical protein